MFTLIDVLREKLQLPLPGIDAQYEMAPVTRKRYPINSLEPGSYRQSAVAILLYEKDQQIHLPLTKRHAYEGKHSGQISFPGGKHDVIDDSLMHTALRELREETGIKGELEVLGKLTPIYIPVSNFYVEPYIIWHGESDVQFEPDTREVKQLIEVELELLKDDTILVPEGMVSGDGYQLKTPYFEVRGEIVWGATAMILNEFRKLI